jgi:DsbC/DsbD-like thiol-disulfide interchange protein
MMWRLVSFFLLFAGLGIAVLRGDGSIEWKLTIAPATNDRTAELILSVSIPEPWHLYGRTGGSQDQVALDLRLKLPTGVEPVSDWAWPKPETIHEGRPIEIYTGEKIFRRKVRFVSAAAGTKLVVSVSFQACTPQYCAPPETVELTAALSPPPATASATK